MFLGSLSMSFMNICAKLVNKYSDISVLEVCYFRGLVMSVGCFYHSYCAGFTVLDIPTSKIGKWIFWRSLLGFMAFGCQFIAVYMMPLSIAIVLYFT